MEIRIKIGVFGCNELLVINKSSDNLHSRNMKGMYVCIRITSGLFGCVETYIVVNKHAWLPSFRSYNKEEKMPPKCDGNKHHNWSIWLY